MEDRLKALILHIGRDKSVFLSGKSDRTLSRYLAGYEVPVSALWPLCQATGTSLDWVLDGNPKNREEREFELSILKDQERSVSAAIEELGVSSPKDVQRGELEDIRKAIENQISKLRGLGYPSTGPYDKAPISSENAKLGSMIHLPVYDEISASAGPGSMVPEERSTSAIAFDPQYLRDLGAKPNQCSVITARGESMKPTIPDGAMLVVDHSQVSVEHGCIYVFNVAERLVVKRARWSMDQTLTLISDNPSPDYPDEQFNDEGAYQLNVVGRVVFHGRRA
jgi:phage repressor protein C with HTH and peptisase S24 domain